MSHIFNFKIKEKDENHAILMIDRHQDGNLQEYGIISEKGLYIHDTFTDVPLSVLEDIIEFMRNKNND